MQVLGYCSTYTLDGAGSYNQQTKIPINNTSHVMAQADVSPGISSDGWRRKSTGRFPNRGGSAQLALVVGSLIGYCRLSNEELVCGFIYKAKQGTCLILSRLRPAADVVLGN